MPFYNHTQSENDLLQACIRNDRRKQELLYKQYCQSMLALCITYTKKEEEAVKVLQDGFFKIFQQIQKFNPAKSSLNDWMQQLMMKTAVDSLIQRNRLSQYVEKIEEDALE